MSSPKLRRAFHRFCSWDWQKQVTVGVVASLIATAIWAGTLQLYRFSVGPAPDTTAEKLSEFETALRASGIMTDGTAVNVFVRHENGDVNDWATDLQAEPGDIVEGLVRYQNSGTTKAEDVMVGVNLPKYARYIEGSTVVVNVNHLNGLPISNDNLTRGGINVGNYSPAAVGLIQFSVEFGGERSYDKCGEFELKFVGIAKAVGFDEFYNTAKVVVDNVC